MSARRGACTPVMSDHPSYLLATSTARFQRPKAELRRSAHDKCRAEGGRLRAPCFARGVTAGAPKRRLHRHRRAGIPVRAPAVAATYSAVQACRWVPFEDPALRRRRHCVGDGQCPRACRRGHANEARRPSTSATRPCSRGAMATVVTNTDPTRRPMRDCRHQAAPRRERVRARRGGVRRRTGSTARRPASSCRRSKGVSTRAENETGASAATNTTSSRCRRPHG